VNSTLSSLTTNNQGGGCHVVLVHTVLRSRNTWYIVRNWRARQDLQHFLAGRRCLRGGEGHSSLNTDYLKSNDDESLTSGGSFSPASYASSTNVLSKLAPLTNNYVTDSVSSFNSASESDRGASLIKRNSKEMWREVLLMPAEIS
jgi:hypothetical protein